MEVRRLSEKSDWSSLTGVFVQRCNPFSLYLYCVSVVCSGIHGASGSLELLMDPYLSPRIIPCECEVTSLQWSIVLWWEVKQKSAYFGGLLPWYWLFLGPRGLRFIPCPELPMSSTMLFIEKQLQHSRAGLLLPTISATFVLIGHWGKSLPVSLGSC